MLVELVEGEKTTHQRCNGEDSDSHRRHSPFFSIKSTQGQEKNSTSANLHVEYFDWLSHVNRLISRSTNTTEPDLLLSRKLSIFIADLHCTHLVGFRIETVAPSGPPTLSRRKSAPAHSLSRLSSSSSSTRIVYGEAKPPPGSAFPFWQKTWFIALLFLMAVGFLGLSVFLFLGLCLDQSSHSSAYAATSEGVEITYGTALKLMHEKTKFRLHSHEVPYGSGSGQQSVTGFPAVDDANSYWIVRPQPGTSDKQGDAIPSGTIIRLQHMKTRKWLHSHLYASPISGNLEVSCFGGESESDTGDYWRLLIEGSGKTWRQDQRVRLQHVDTSGYLHSHDKKYQQIAGGQQEVCGIREKKPDNVWLAAEGVYLPVAEKK